MTDIEIQSVIDRVGWSEFAIMVGQAIEDRWDVTERVVGQYHPNDPFRQEVRRAVRLCAESGRGDK